MNLSTLNLAPYNRYVLYASMLLVAVMLIILLTKLLDLKKTIDGKMPLINKMTKQAELSAIKLEAVNEKKAEDKKKNRVWNIALPIVLAIYHNYGKVEENGVKGVFKSTKRIASDEKERNKLIAKVRKAM